MAVCCCTSQGNFQEYSCERNDRPGSDKHSVESPLGCDEGATQGSDEVAHKQGGLVIGEDLACQCFWSNARDEGINTW